MDILLIITLALVGGTLALVLYPLWRQTRDEATFRVDRAGRTLAEYEARYQAALAAIKDLMFDYEMGKVLVEDYETLLAKSKLEAAQIRRQIDLLSQSSEPEIDPAIAAKIETLVAELKSSDQNGNEALWQDVEAEIETLKNVHLDATCPNCGKPIQVGDTFCSGCGQSLAEVKTQRHTCSKCGAPIQPDDAFCAKCGTAWSKLATRKQKSSKK